MKTQLLQDIGESRSFARSARLADTAPPDAERLEPPLEQDPPPPDPTDWNPFAFEGLGRDGFDEQRQQSHWFVRWGRKLATSSLVLTACAMLVAAGIWFYQETKVENAMVVLAQQSLPEREPPAAMVMQAPAAASETAAPALPVLQAEEAAPPPAQAKPGRKPPLKAATSRAEPTSSRARQMDETLRQCRMAGYHAAQCIERGCLMTRYGLACKG